MDSHGKITGILLSLYNVTISCPSWCVSCVSPEPTFLPSCVVFFRLAACFSFVCFRWNELELLPMPLLIYLLSPFLSLIVSIHLVTSLIQSVLRLHFYRCRPHKLWFWLIGFLRDNPPSRHCVVLYNTHAIPPFCSFHWKMSFVRANSSTAANLHQKSFFPVLYFSLPRSHLTCSLSLSALLYFRADTKCALSCALVSCVYCVAGDMLLWP